MTTRKATIRVTFDVEFEEDDSPRSLCVIDQAHEAGLSAISFQDSSVSFSAETEVVEVL